VCLAAAVTAQLTHPYHIGRVQLLHHNILGAAMSLMGHKRTLAHVRVMSALPPKADIETGPVISFDAATRQLGDIDGDPSRLVFGEELRR
jgi:hypothetical protein